MAQRNIPRYFVYGEPARELGPGFVHVECVSDRGSVHRGQVEAHSHPNMSQLTCWIKGHGHYSIDHESWSFSAPSLAWLPSGVVHGFEVTPGADAIVLSISDAALPAVRPAAASFTLLQPENDIWRELAALLALMQRLHRFEQQAALLPLAAAALALATPLLQSSAASPAHSLAQRLKAVVDARFREPLRVDDYVKALSSTYHLVDKASRTGFGLPLKQMIVERRMLEAKRLLKFTVRSAEDIAIELGFDDPAYFNRMFKAHAGLSPIAWRRAQSGAV